jgi:hypothetical protein
VFFVRRSTSTDGGDTTTHFRTCFSSLNALY